MAFKVLLVSLLCSAVGSIVCNNVITQRRLKASDLIQVGMTNFAIHTPGLEERDWVSVSVNKDEVETVSRNCRTETTKMSTMSKSDRTAIFEASNRLNNIEYEARYKSVYYQVVQYAAHGNVIEINIHNKKKGDNPVAREAHDFTAAEETFPNNIQRLFVSNNVVTLVYKDGRISMKPESCASGEEQQLIADLRDGIECLCDEEQNPADVPQERQLLQEHNRRQDREHVSIHEKGQLKQKRLAAQLKSRIAELRQQLLQLLQQQLLQLIEQQLLELQKQQLLAIKSE